MKHLDGPLICDHCHHVISGEAIWKPRMPFREAKHFHKGPDFPECTIAGGRFTDEDIVEHLSQTVDPAAVHHVMAEFRRLGLRLWSGL